jgi:hypothetical protein
VLAAFADKTVRRHVMNAPSIPANTFELLNDCTSRVIRDGTFNPRRRDGHVYGHHLPELIRALLLAAAERNAPRAVRFANGVECTPAGGQMRLAFGNACRVRVL